MSLDRRKLIGALVVGVFALGTLGPLSAQEAVGAKAEVQRAEARRTVTEAVNEMTANAEKQLGAKFTTAEKAQMVDSILERMEGEDIYAFVE